MAPPRPTLGAATGDIPCNKLVITVHYAVIEVTELQKLTVHTCSFTPLLCSFSLKAKTSFKSCDIHVKIM